MFSIVNIEKLMQKNKHSHFNRSKIQPLSYNATPYLLVQISDALI